MKRLRGPGGITVEAVEYVDSLGYRWRVLRARQYERRLADFSSVQALAKVIDVSALVEEDDDQADEENPRRHQHRLRRSSRPGERQVHRHREDDGRSLRVGDPQRPDGTWALRITELPNEAA